MIGHVGSVKALPKAPRSDDPMALLTVLGDPERAKEAKVYLTELNAVLVENMKVRDDALAATAEAEKRITQANEAERKARDSERRKRDESETAAQHFAAERAAVETAYQALDDRTEQLERQQQHVDDLANRLREIAKHLTEWAADD